MGDTVSKRLRFEIFKRDGFKCQYCGRTPPDVVLHVDHVVPKSGGGGSEDDNLLTACADCNLGKGPIPMERVAAPLNLNTEERKEKLEQLQRYAEFKLEEREFQEYQFGEVVVLWAKREGQPEGAKEVTYPTKLEAAAKHFLKLLPLSEVLDAVDITFHKCESHYGRLKYFCAVCWHKIRKDLPGLR